MTEADQGGTAAVSTQVSARVVIMRMVTTVAVVAGIAGTGVAIYRNQRASEGMPRAIAPTPRETPAPSVEDEITRLDKQVAASPDDADAWRSLGWSYFQREQYQQSADALRHATMIDPTNARTFSFLGEALVLDHKPRHRMAYEARAAFDTALRLDPKDARARYFRAVGWDLAGQHRRAIHAWLALLTDTPADAPYAGDIRAVIRTVGARHHIKVEKRLAEVRFAAPVGNQDNGLPHALPGGAAARSGAPPVHGHGGGATLPGPIGEHIRSVEGLPRPDATDAAKGE